MPFFQFCLAFCVLYNKTLLKNDLDSAIGLIVTQSLFGSFSCKWHATLSLTSIVLKEHNMWWKEVLLINPTPWNYWYFFLKHHISIKRLSNKSKFWTNDPHLQDDCGKMFKKSCELSTWWNDKMKTAFLKIKPNFKKIHWPYENNINKG